MSQQLKQRLADLLFNGDTAVFDVEAEAIQDPETKKLVTQVITVLSQYSQVAEREDVVGGLLDVVGAASDAVPAGATPPPLDLTTAVPADVAAAITATAGNDPVLQKSIAEKTALTTVICTVLDDVAAGVTTTGEVDANRTAGETAVAIDAVLLAVSELESDTADQTAITPSDILAKKDDSTIRAQAASRATAAVANTARMVVRAADGALVPATQVLQGQEVADLAQLDLVALFADAALSVPPAAFVVKDSAGALVSGPSITTTYEPTLVGGSPPEAGVYTAKHVIRAAGFRDTVFLQTVSVSKLNATKLSLLGGRFVDVTLAEDGTASPAAGVVGCAIRDATGNATAVPSLSVVVTAPDDSTVDLSPAGGAASGFDAAGAFTFDQRGVYTVRYSSPDCEPSVRTQVVTTDYDADFEPLTVALQDPQTLATVTVTGLVAAMDAAVDAALAADPASTYAQLHDAGVVGGLRYVRAAFASAAGATGDEWAHASARAVAAADLGVAVKPSLAATVTAMVGPVTGLKNLRRALGRTLAGDAANARPTFVPRAYDYAVRYSAVLALENDRVLRVVTPLEPGIRGTYAVTAAGGRYSLDGEEAPALALERGRVYRFDQTDASNDTHRDLMFEVTTDGGATYAPYTAGVTASGSVVEFAVPEDAPAAGLRYACPNHAGMGGHHDGGTSDRLRPLERRVALTPPVLSVALAQAARTVPADADAAAIVASFAPAVAYDGVPDAGATAAASKAQVVALRRALGTAEGVFPKTLHLDFAATNKFTGAVVAARATVTVELPAAPAFVAERVPGQATLTYGTHTTYAAPALTAGDVAMAERPSPCCRPTTPTSSSVLASAARETPALRVAAVPHQARRDRAARARGRRHDERRGDPAVAAADRAPGDYRRALPTTLSSPTSTAASRPQATLHDVTQVATTMDGDRAAAAAQLKSRQPGVLSVRFRIKDALGQAAVCPPRRSRPRCRPGRP